MTTFAVLLLMITAVHLHTPCRDRERASNMYQFLGSFCVTSPTCSDDFGVKEGAAVGEFVAAFRERIPASADDVEGALALLWEAVAVASAHKEDEDQLTFVKMISLRLLGYVGEAFKHRQPPSPPLPTKFEL